MVSDNNCTPRDFSAKCTFVERVFRAFKPQNVLDVGCNTGHFSFLAAKSGARVVAIDQDPVVVGRVWRKASSERLDILPLVIDLTRPSPAVGWLNRECRAFLDRARGGFDVVLMLAVLHHMLVNARIPLPEIIALAAELTTDLLIIEYVGPDDPLFRRLARGRDHLFTDLTQSLFESTCRRNFQIAQVQRLGATARWIYLLTKNRTS